MIENFLLSTKTSMELLSGSKSIKLCTYKRARIVITVLCITLRGKRVLKNARTNQKGDEKMLTKLVNTTQTKEKKTITLVVRNITTYIICDAFVMTELSGAFSYVEEDYENTRDRKVEWWLRQNNPEKARKAAEWDGSHSLIKGGVLGTGLVEDLIMYLLEKKYVFNIENKMEKNGKNFIFQHKIPIVLRERQEEAMEAMREADFRGIVNASVSFGKTHLGLYTMSELNKITVILSTKKEIIQQWKKRIEEIFMLTSTRLGSANGYIFTNDSGEVGVLLCTPTLIHMAEDKHSKAYSTSRYEKIREIINKTGFVIYDEAHHASSQTSMSSLNAIHAYYRIGLSGTVNMRSDSSDYYYLASFGNIIYSFTVSDLVRKGEGKKVIVKPIVIKYDRVFLSQVSIQSEEWSDFHTNFIVENRDRNAAITNIIMKELTNGSHILVLVDRINHGSLLATGFPSEHVTTSSSKDSKSLRDEKFMRFRKGEIKCMICTFDLAGEGFDVPSLNVLIIAGGKSEIKIRQAVGRIMRKSDREFATLYDFVDPISPFQSHFLKRLEVYKSETAFEIETDGLPFWVTRYL